ncbi:hypothetical protein CERSUDRAFT_53222 [Gelatoporia subvermispora B]|uniref:Cytochrome P450 n=1 Tax=Ceriporiopsis subvermispora (strain B) TaxID=914234 RepID=M2RAU5_CERS8|nr:hypothetical protein CERSUDRAFT_53222 [Gelatoporia subvermispora B]
MTLSVALAISFLTLLLVFLRKRTKQQLPTYRDLPLPPGPRPLPFLGNVFDIPKDTEYLWRTYAKWAQTHGDIVHIQVLGKHIIVLHSLDAVHDLLDKRSSIYADREITEVIALTGWDWNLAMMKYGQQWRDHRQLFHQYMNERVIHTYDPYIRDGTRRLLKGLHCDPKNYTHHLRYALGEIVLSLIYGIRIEENNDYYVELLAAAMKAVEEAVLPGSLWVDFLPYLKYVPHWVPGTGWQKKVENWRAESNAIRNAPWENMVVSCTKDRTSPPIAAQMSEQISDMDDDGAREMKHTAQNVCAVMHAGRTTLAPTTISTLQTFILAMVLHPEAQRSAQRELDTVVGRRRLPNSSDLSALPYTRALLKECMRWQPVAPLSFARRCTTDNEYRGCLIPEGALIFQNSWFILHDPGIFPEPEGFKPERYLKDGVLNPDILDPTVVTFGAGRRICPGRHLAESMLFLTIARILHTFEITPVLDAKGTPINPEVKMTSGLLSYPTPFECSISSRGAWAEALINEEYTRET